MMERTVRASRPVLYATMAIWSAALLVMAEGAAELAENVTSGLDENATSELRENATAPAVWMGPAVEGNPHRGPRQAEQRDQRCALPSFVGGGTSSGETADTVLESTRTVDRYLVKPATYYENRVMYREKPAVANVLMRRRRPVPVQRIGLLPYYVQRMDFADRGRRPLDGEAAVSMTADDVRRLLQRVYSEGVIAGGEGAAAGPNFDSKVLPLKG
ncbi:uncharacterized protein LOC132937095 [Metopolophium dirhodum]|uniref:uncharacterized protein LOC132937095 n=1 Tax=Metopolophium dirhodum TaxID=44670 RepID=UPI0029906DC1|nr:uncharacterized protein LOC132937095 [Metopolophium dirhodum]XP_060859904.1 uncharacterized protein LOC132937095 [Metopolophium dirhodum]